MMNSHIIQKMDLFNSKYKCKICRKRLRYKADEIIHSSFLHDQIVSEKCNLCEYEYKNFYDLRLHLMKLHLNEKPYVCRMCNKKFFAFIHLKNHCKNHLKNNSNIKNLIDYENSNVNDTVQALNFDHLNIKQEIKTTTFLIITGYNVKKCFSCDEIFDSNGKYLLHIWTKHMNEKSLTCWECQSNFITECDFLSHLNSHLTNNNSYKCSICLKDDMKFFDTIENAKKHYLSDHLKTDKYSFQLACSICDKLIEDSIQTHYTKCIPKVKYEYKCEYCNFMFNEIKIYNVHINQHKVHESVRTNKRSCFGESIIDNVKKPLGSSRIDNIALKLISMKQKRQKDIDLEREEDLIVNSPFIIYPNDLRNNYSNSTISSSAFALPSSNHNTSLLGNNYLDDTILKNESFMRNSMIYFNQNYSPMGYKCEYCGYSFKTNLELDAHKLMHLTTNSKRPYKCHLCLVTFSKIDQLKRHMIVHQVKDQDSVCQICFSSFSRKQDLDRHLLFHSK